MNSPYYSNKQVVNNVTLPFFGCFLCVSYVECYMISKVENKSIGLSTMSTKDSILDLSQNNQHLLHRTLIEDIEGVSQNLRMG